MSLSPRLSSVVARLLGAGALLASGAIHLDLYLTGYRSIPTIGPLFLVQTAAALLVGVLVVVRADRNLALAASLFAVGTLAGYLLSRSIGILGFVRWRRPLALPAGLLESSAFLLLGEVTLTVPSSSATRPPRTLWSPGSFSLSAHTTAIRIGVLAGAAAAVALTFVAGLGAVRSGPGQSGPSQSSPGHSRLGKGAGGSSITILIKNFAFVPANFTVRPGEHVVVQNEDPVAHTLTAVPGSTPFGDFNTGNIGSGQTKELVAPSRAGSYQYCCAIHNFITGVMTVKS